MDGKELRKFDELFVIMEQIQKNRRIENQDPELKYKMDSLIEEFGDPKYLKFDITWDSSTISKEFLLENLDYAMKVKSEKKWLHNIPTEIFNNYVLPYRVASERLEDNQRSRLYDFYNFIRKSSKARQEVFEASKSTDMLKFASDVQYEISRRLSTNGTMWGYPFDVPISKMEKGRQGSCRHLVNYTTAAMRAVGLPVVSDFTPKWGNSYTGHKWNVLFLEDGRELPFDAGSSTLSFNIEDRKVVKVFREEFARDSNFVTPPVADVPLALYSPYWKDVTKTYNKVADITLDIPKDIASKKKYVLIGTFNNSDWEPQFYGKVIGAKVKYNQLGVNNVYIGMYLLNNDLRTFGDPFIVDSNGKIRYLVKSKKSTNQVLLRKYPRNSWVASYENSMVGAKFEYANLEDFSDSKVLTEIKDAPDSVVKIGSLREKFRYIRYVFPDLQRVYIGEISFFKNNQVMDVKPVNIESKVELGKINDQDINSYYWGKKAEEIVYDFGEETEIESIHYAPRSDSNFIVEGNEYELCCWSNGKWESLYLIDANSSALKFKDVPEGPLFLLHNLTKGREERIFTYESGKQVWW